MTFEELVQAAKIFSRITEIRSYVTRERFDMVAQTRFGIEDEQMLDVMYGMLNMTPKAVKYIAAYDNEEARKSSWYPKAIKYLPKAIEIAESAYSLRLEEWGSNDIPCIEHTRYRKNDMRRYFYNEGGVKHILDVRLWSRSDIILLSELLNKDEVKLDGVTEHLGYLEGEMKGNGKEKFQYFNGDIYLLYGNPADRVFYSYVDAGDAGVYVATEKGWRKLLYTPTRGYITNEGNPDFADEEHFYSDYMLEGSGKGFHYVGNIYDDISVLIERKQKD